MNLIRIALIVEDDRRCRNAILIFQNGDAVKASRYPACHPSLISAFASSPDIAVDKVLSTYGIVY